MYVVWGFGSIGQRHTQNLQTLGAAVTVISRSAPAFAAEHPSLDFVSSLTELSSAEIQGLIIASPTALHVEHLSQALDAGFKKIYLEKPVSHSYEGIEQLSERIDSLGAQVYVGYDLRFDPGIQKTKALLQTEDIGPVCSFQAQVGQYLPDWRPAEDYREGMSAQAALGGGVMLDLVHELDYLYHLFGEVDAIMNSNGHRSELEIETEDSSDSLLLFKSGISGTLHMDYLQKELCRNLHIVGSRGVIHLDLAARNIRWNSIEHAEWQREDFSGIERNDRFLATMQAFMQPEPSPLLCTWEHALVSLQWVLLSKKSGLSGQLEKLEG